MVYPPRVNSGAPDGAPECISCKIQLRPDSNLIRQLSGPDIRNAATHTPDTQQPTSSIRLHPHQAQTEPRTRSRNLQSAFVYPARSRCIADEVHLLLSTQDQSLA
ncbi:hypothetical protein D3C71_463690 [compost metagenome]